MVIRGSFAKGNWTRDTITSALRPGTIIPDIVSRNTRSLGTTIRGSYAKGNWTRASAPARIGQGSLRESLPASVTRSIIPAIMGAPSAPVSTASMGGGAIAQAPAPTSGLGGGLSGGLGEVGTQLGGGLTNIGSSISKTATDYLPLAIKVVIAVIVIKIVLWLVRAGGRR